MKPDVYCNSDLNQQLHIPNHFYICFQLPHL